MRQRWPPSKGRRSARREGRRRGWRSRPPLKEFLEDQRPRCSATSASRRRRSTALGGCKVQGRSHHEAAEKILDRGANTRRVPACARSSSNACPPTLAKEITKTPTRSRRSASAQGPHCDGQVLVSDDMLGLSEAGPPDEVRQALRRPRHGGQGRARGLRDRRALADVPRAATHVRHGGRRGRHLQISVALRVE